MSTVASNTTILRLGRAERELVESEDRLDLLGSDYFLDLVIDEIAWESEGAEIDVLSLDVFDTILVRNDKSELRRFAEIAQEMAGVLNRDPLEVLVARLTATRASYRTSAAHAGYREGDIEDIHGIALTMLGLPRDRAREMVELELDYETRNLTLNPVLLPLVDALGSPELVAASNMYLRSGHIATLLSAAGAPPTRAVFSSTEEKATKNDTRLLLKVRDLYVDRPATILHIGDSYASDFVPAKRLGWFAQWWPIPRLSQQARRRDAVACIAELEQGGLALGSLGTHFVEHP